MSGLKAQTRATQNDTRDHRRIKKGMKVGARRRDRKRGKREALADRCSHVRLGSSIDRAARF